MHTSREELKCRFVHKGRVRLFSLLNQQQGQSSVFILAMLGVILISAIFLYQSGRLTTEKMQLQNAADAAAFSASTLEARSMNFAAYTNRAMAANEIAIAQCVGLLSLAHEFEMINEYLSAYGLALDAIGVALEATVFGAPVGVVLQAIATVLETIGEGFEAVGSTMDEFLSSVAPVWIKAFSVINTIYSYAQEAYHYATVALVTDSIFGNLQGNVVGTSYSGNIIHKITSPPSGGAKLSGTFDILALVGHFATYISGYTKRYSADDEDAIGRLAATVREARDPFTSGEGSGSRNWQFGLESEESIHIHIPWPIDKTLKFGYELGFGMYSQGGSELIKKEQFVWSGIDASGVKASFHVYPIGGFTSPAIPTGGGASQANGGENILSFGDFSDSMGDISPSGYGGAPGYNLSWEQARETITERDVEDAPYSGLKPYRDVALGEQSSMEKALDKFFPATSPFFLIGVVKDLNKLEQEGPQFTGDLKTVHGSQHNDIIATVAKSEVYFKRPTLLPYFQREDGLEEKASLFSPFWQARLVQPKDYDRFITIALQQKKIWASKNDQKAIPEIPNLIDKIEHFLDLLP